MRDRKNEGSRWFIQVEHVLRAAQYSREGGFDAVACFQAQQAGEKAREALRFARRERVVLGHSIAELGHLCATYEPKFSKLTMKVGKLDRFYIPTRYPNGLPAGVPAQVYDEVDSKDAVAMASELVEFVRERLESGPER
jgi:HEPN domain-containing protein